MENTILGNDQFSKIEMVRTKGLRNNESRLLLELHNNQLAKLIYGKLGSLKLCDSANYLVISRFDFFHK